MKEHGHQDYDRINKHLCRVLYNNYKKQFKNVIEQEQCDIDGSFLGFIDAYYYLSRLIPLGWTIIDFGCAYAPQAYYFRKHKKYIGVNPTLNIRFAMKNTSHFVCTIKEFFEQGLCKHLDRNKVMAICNYVPSPETELVRINFPNCYVFYPA